MIELQGASVRAGSFLLSDVTLSLPTGSWTLALGPAGAGKTTLLEAIAGLRPLAAGHLLLRGGDAGALPPERRGIGLVPQHGLLFPHLDVAANVRYAAATQEAVTDAVERLEIAPLLARAVSSLSGGERALVALARALVPRPDILLLDEPFAALDPRRRQTARRALATLQAERGLTVLQVTHDLSELLSLSTHLLVLQAGRLLQAGVIADVWTRPHTPAVAELLGVENILPGRVQATAEGCCFTHADLQLQVGRSHPGGAAHALVRAEDVTIRRSGSDRCDEANSWMGRVTAVEPDRAVARVTLRVGSTLLAAAVSVRDVAALELAEGREVCVHVDRQAVHLC